MRDVRLLALLPAILVVAACGGGTADEQPAPAAVAPIPSGGLSVSEAIASDLDGPLMVRGYVILTAVDEYRLCEGILESDPPQCGEPSLAILPPSEELRELAESQQQASLLGEIDGRILRIGETSR